MENEIWKSVVDYEGLYEISNLGRIKSLKKKRFCKRNNSYSTFKERIMKPNKSSGYYLVSLYKDGMKKVKAIHSIVAESFLNHKPNGFKLVVNHKNFNKLDNRLDNLEIITHRENSNMKHIKSSSEYVGVSLHYKTKKWRAAICINGKTKHLGLFKNEIDASNCYQEYLSNYITDFETLKNEIK